MFSGNKQHNDKAIEPADFNQALHGTLAAIEHSAKVVISSHINPDGDSIGSELALYFYLKAKNKQVSIINCSPVPSNYKFLPGADLVNTYDSSRDDKFIDEADLVIIPDLNDCSRLMDVCNPIMFSKAKKVIIDHHTDPKSFADVYLIDEDATSSGEIVWKLIALDSSFHLTKEIAENLYVAIMTDTGSFRFPRTDEEIHRIIAGLIKSGADPVSLYDNVYNKMSLKAMHLLGDTLSSSKLYHDGRLCLMVIPKEFFVKNDAVEDDIDNFVERTLSIKGVEIGILITEVAERNEIRLSFRSRGKYSVRELAALFGGGGHIHAAGGRVNNTPLHVLIERVLEESAKVLGK